MKKLLAVAAMLALSLCGYAQSLDPNFNPFIGHTEVNHRGHLFDDGSFLLYGDFLRVNGTNQGGIAKFNSNGSLVSFATTNANVSAVAIQPDGKILMTGTFTSVSGIERMGLVRLNTNGTIDESFNPTFTEFWNGDVLAIQGDGKILLGGYFRTSDESPQLYLARFNDDGSFDESFEAPEDLGSIKDLEIQADGKILAGGVFDKGLVRLNADGSKDETLNLGAGFEGGYVTSVEMDSVDRIIVSGYFQKYQGIGRKGLVAINADGSYDNGFPATAQINNSVYSIHVQHDGKLLVAGLFSGYGATSSKNLLRLNADGTFDPSFEVGTGTDNLLNFVTQNSSTGNVLITGYPSQFTSYNSAPTPGIAILGEDGILKPLSETPVVLRDWPVRQVEVLNGQILIAHQGNFVNDEGSTGFNRLNADGSVDLTFNAHNAPDGTINKLVKDSEGRILIGGNFQNYAGTATGRLARLDADGNLDFAFNGNLGSGFNSFVNAIVEQPDNTILVGGNFDQLNGNAAKNLVRLNSNGTVDGGFDIGDGFNGAVTAIKVQHDGKILVGGSFTVFDGNPISGLVRLNTDGSFDDSFQNTSGFESSYLDIAVIEIIAEDRILVGGSFETYDGVGSPDVILLNQDGTLYKTRWDLDWRYFWRPNSILKTADGKMFVTDQDEVYRLNADATLDETFKPFDVKYTAYDIDTIGNSLYIAGSFFQVFGEIRGGIAKMNLPTTNPIPPDITLSQKNINSVELSWETSDNISLITVERSTTTNDNFTEVISQGFSENSYTDSPVTPNGTYFYRLKVYNAFGSVYTNEAEITLESEPLAVTNMEAEPHDADTLLLTWEDNSDNESYFVIYRRAIIEVGFVPYDTVEANQTSYFDVEVEAGTSYSYYITAINQWGTSQSNFAYGTPESAIPLIPSNFWVYANTPGSIEVQWAYFSNIVDAFEVERSIEGGAFELIASVDGDVRSYVDNDVTRAVNYSYRVRALNDGYLTDYTNVLTEMIGPLPPANLQVEAISSTALRLTWEDNSSDEDGFIIRRSLTSSFEEYEEIEVFPSIELFNDTELLIGNTYYYRVAAVNQEAESEFVEADFALGVFVMKNITYTTCEGVLLDPGGAGEYPTDVDVVTTLIPETSGASVQLVFPEPLAFASFFYDELIIHNGTSTEAPIIGHYWGWELDPDTVRAKNLTGALTIVFKSHGGETGEGFAANISCVIVPLTPESIDVQVINTEQYQVTWNDVATNETGYVIERSIESYTDFYVADTLAANTDTFIDTEGTPGTAYYYRVRALGETENSDYSQITAISVSQAGFWKLRNFIGERGIEGGVGFALGDKGYIGLGYAGGGYSSQMYEYDPATNQVTEIENLPGGARVDAVSFVINNKGYVCTGDGQFDYDNTTWAYDAQQLTWTEKASFPGEGRRSATAFSVGGNGYVGLGSAGFESSYFSDFWKYDPVTDSWTQIAEFPGTPRHGATAFVLNGFAYVGYGYDGTARLEDFYRYDPATDNWTDLGFAGGGPRQFAAAFTLNGKAFVGTGDPPFAGYLKDFWSYNPDTEVWTGVMQFGGTERYDAVAFSIGDKGYLATGYDFSTRNDVWEFTQLEIPEPPPPPLVSATAQGHDQIQVEWEYDLQGVQYFTVEQAEGTSEDFQLVATVSSFHPKGYGASGLQEYTTYSFRVKAYFEAGSSDYSDIATAKTFALPPAAPNGLMAEGISTSAVELQWDDLSNEEMFELQRRLPAEVDFQVVVELNPNTTTYVDSGLDENTEYVYRLRASRGGVASEYSQEVTASTLLDIPDAPTNLHATLGEGVNLQWTDESSNEEGFTIFRSFDGNTYDSIGTVATTSFQTNLDPSRSLVFYGVTAFNATGSSSKSNIVMLTITATDQSPEDESISIFPNPVQDVMHVELNSAEKGIVNFALVDMIGHEVDLGSLRKSNDRLQASFYVGNIPGGVRIVKMTLNGLTVYRRVVFE